ncbi:glycosyltransferase [Rosistilla oblonga]|uniref:glycosyltransferase n=1 Tax=Rosistilla oblonga TaxID=2527990 RepID=UPI003A972A50
MEIGKRPVRIVARQNGVGLDRDVQLLQSTLPPGTLVENYSVRSLASIADRFKSLCCSPAPGSLPLNVLVERVPWAWVKNQGQSVLLPNQERFPKRLLHRLRDIDIVLCKSRHAEEIFSRHAKQARFIGFTSLDRRLPEVAPDYGKFFHLAGSSTLKGTQMLLELWSQNPQWPTLTIVQHPRHAPETVPANVALFKEYLTDAVLQRMQNEHGIHLCPSRSEGWGHYIVEAMSCAAVVVTTDAPPMNELVDESRGFLVPWNRSQPRHLGTDFFVDPAELQRVINEILATDTASLEQRGQAARAWFETNEVEFETRARELFLELLQ